MARMGVGKFRNSSTFGIFGFKSVPVSKHALEMTSRGYRVKSQNGAIGLFSDGWFKCVIIFKATNDEKNFTRLP